jgi:hypothetical protein
MSTIKSSAENLTLNADGANNDVIIQSNGSTKVTLDGQNSRVGIGITSPASELHVYGGAGANVGIQSSAGSHWKLGDAVGSSNGNFVIYDYTNSAKKVDIMSTGMQVANGILFNSDSAAANALDDYEEGTWTPVLSDGTNNATSGGNTGGIYTKIGRIVHASGYLITSSLGSVSGSIRITGLPFTIANTWQNYAAGSIAWAENHVITAGQSISLLGTKNGTHMRIELWDSTQGITNMQSGEWSSDGQIAFSLTYST